MLKLPQKHTNDEKANGIIAQYLNGNILRLVKDEIADYEDIREKEAHEDDPAFCRAVSMFFRNITLLKKWGKYFSDCRRFWSQNMSLFRSWLWSMSCIL